MSLRWILLLIGPLLICHAPAVQAGSPELKESCKYADNVRVPTKYDPDAPRFAKAIKLDTGGFIITINPNFYYLGQKTQQWLYLRQCAHIRSGNTLPLDSKQEFDIQKEEKADCQAVMFLFEEPQNSKRILYTIERDLKRVQAKRLWRQVLPGPQRNISLSHCLKSKNK